MAQGDRVYLGLIQINAWSNEERVIISNHGENGAIEDGFTYHNSHRCEKRFGIG